MTKANPGVTASDVRLMRDLLDCLALMRERAAESATASERYVAAHLLVSGRRRLDELAEALPKAVR